MIPQNLKGLYTEKNLSFVKPDQNTFYLNSASRTPISRQSLEAVLNYHQSIGGVIDSKNKNEESEGLMNLVDETKKLLLQNLNLQEKEWDIVFLSDAAIAANVAVGVISQHLWNIQSPLQEFDNWFVAGYHPLSNSALTFALKKAGNQYGMEVLEADSKLDLVYNGKVMSDLYPKVHKVIGLPYIDSVVGYGHYEHYVSTIPNKRFYGDPMKYSHLILDATQGGLFLLNPIKRNLPNLAPCGAIILDGSKIHSDRLGILAIRKKYFEGLDLFNVVNVASSGGSVESLEGSKHQVLKPNFFASTKGVQGDDMPVSSILALGALLDSLLEIEYDLVAEMQDFVQKLKLKIRSMFEPEFDIVSVQAYTKLRDTNNFTNNIILLNSKRMSNPEMHKRLIDKGIVTGCGCSGCEYGYARYHICDGIRISLDWSLVEEDIDKILAIMSDVVDGSRKERMKSLF